MYSHVQINLGQFYFSKVMWAEHWTIFPLIFAARKNSRFHLFLKVDKWLYFSKQFYRKMPNDNKITPIELLILVKIFFSNKMLIN
jgi:hypothetical protein